jgi:hypothetical protein
LPSEISVAGLIVLLYGDTEFSMSDEKPTGSRALASAIVSDEQARALSAVANFGTTVVTESSNLARYIGRIVGTVPEDVVGLFLGDPLHAVRTLAAQWYDDKIREIHARRNVKRLEAVSLSVAIPLLRGAYDENREQLRELWAALIAAATDQERTGRVRLSFIDALRQFDPLDALILKERSAISGAASPTVITYLQARLGTSGEDIEISVENLTRLKCALYSPGNMANFGLTSFGRGLLRAVSD